MLAQVCPEVNQEATIGIPLLAKSISDLLVHDVVGHARPVYTVNTTSTVAEVVRVLSDQKISGAPVVDAQGLLCGSIDYSDILHHIIAFGCKNGKFETTESLRTHWEKFRAVYLADVSTKNPLLRLTGEDKLSDALEILFSGVHRILVVQKENRRKVVNVLTQYDVLKYLNAHSELLPVSKQLQAIKTLGIGTLVAGKLHSILPETPAKDAFLTMRILNLRALPIVDCKGMLISQLSSSDLRLIFKTEPLSLDLLDLSCLDYAKKVREARGGKDLLVWIEPEDNLSCVLQKMVKESVHRVFVTDNLSSLRGVITITDLATVLC